ncbi:hypothetical protein GGX14DRAFT_352965 [Mycena pura]|uniref:DUF6593 domain-containing protein n=1 Tax=Mycena pura TaxID=153505 RepID=A0AAD6YIB4_9AGAR|nr:hypothetical protein GGX14DRAFT_352965 [Mycena pura]
MAKHGPTWGVSPSIRGAVPQYTAGGRPRPRPDSSSISSGFAPLDLFTLRVLPYARQGTILNATLVSADGRVLFFVTTDATSGSERTVVLDGNRARVAIITWDAHPTVYIDDLGWSLHTAQWLCLSSTRTCRTMIASGKQFSWLPNGECIELFPLDSLHTQALASISHGSDGTVLQLTSTALRLNLLNMTAISTVLLMSGRSID